MSMQAHIPTIGGMNPVRLLLVDDEVAVRRGLRMRLEAEPNLTVVGEAPNGRVALELVEALRPRIVVMDVRMPELDGISATAAIRSAFPETDVLILTMHDDGATRAAAARAGAYRLIAKHLVDEALLPAIYELASQMRPAPDTDCPL